MMVSVIIPVFNGEKTIERAIKSVHGQTFVDQLILINDASNDQSLSIMERWKEEYLSQNGELGHTSMKVNLINFKDNLGVSAARNQGLKLVTSPFLSFLDADDEYLSGRFCRDVRLLLENTKIAGIYAPVRVKYDSDWVKKRHSKVSNEKEVLGDMKLKPHRLFSAFLGTAGNYFLLSGLLIRRHFALQIGFFKPELLYCQDTDWLLRIIATLPLLPSEYNNPMIIVWRHASNRVLTSSLACYYRLKMLNHWVPFVMVRKDFNFFERIFFVRSLLDCSVENRTSLAWKLKKWEKIFCLFVEKPALLIWIIKN